MAENTPPKGPHSDLPQSLTSFFGQAVPKIIAAEGQEACRQFLEFFTANIRNKNTRAAYAQAVGQFCRWRDRRRFSLELIEPITVGPTSKNF